MGILMFKSLKILVNILFLLSSSIAFSQSIEGLQEIVKLQQDKISSIEDNLKKLIGSIEEQSNLNKFSSNSKLFENQINNINQKLRLLESNFKNITNLVYDLDFSLKRIERHLELSSIQANKSSKKVSSSNNKKEYKVLNNPEIQQESLNAKTDGVLGFIKETNDKESKNKQALINNQNNKKPEKRCNNVIL